MLFNSFMMGGFECSTHRRRDGRRLDVIAATQHERFARQDYERLAKAGMLTARDGIRWHSVERSPGRFDLSSVAAQIDAAQEYGVRVIWDLFHYGYPDDIDIFGDEFPRRLCDLAAAFARFHVERTGEAPLVIPVNEISFFAWIAGDVGHFYPYAIDRGDELKRNLAKAAIDAARVVKQIAPGAKVLSSEPLVYVTARENDSHLSGAAESYRMSQYEAIDMLTGRLVPELGGGPDCVDVLGINYYPHNQWFWADREMIPLGDPAYHPLSALLKQVADRYERPMFIAETGTEGSERIPWFKYVAGEVEAALYDGTDIIGVCLYPVVNHPGWDDERHCHNGVWDYAVADGFREPYTPLLIELQRWGAEIDSSVFNRSLPYRSKGHAAGSNIVSSNL